jgi:hypothetical protein
MDNTDSDQTTKFSINLKNDSGFNIIYHVEIYSAVKFWYGGYPWIWEIL